MVVALAASAPAAGAARASTPPPPGFIESPPATPHGRDFKQLKASSVRTYRLLLSWIRVERPAPRSDGTHSYYDSVFVNTGRRGVRIMPLLDGSPRWAASRSTYPPTTSTGKLAFRRFAAAAAKR